MKVNGLRLGPFFIARYSAVVALGRGYNPLMPAVPYVCRHPNLKHVINRLHQCVDCDKMISRSAR